MYCKVVCERHIFALSINRYYPLLDKTYIMKFKQLNQTVIVAACFSMLALGVYGLALSATLAQHSVRLPHYKVTLKGDLVKAVVKNGVEITQH